MQEVVDNDTRRAEEAKKVIAALEAKKSAASNVVIITQQLAIRSAAQKKMTALVPAIRAAVKSENPFVRLAAEDALSVLDKTYKEASTVAATPRGIGEIEALPSSTRAVFTFNLRPEGLEPSRTTMEAMAAQIGEVVGEPPPPHELEKARREILNWVKTYGNMRPERVVVAQVGGIKPTAGGLGIIVRGLFERDVLEKTLSSHPLWAVTEKTDWKLFSSPFLRLVVLSDRSVLILPHLASTNFPLENYMENLPRRKKPIHMEPRLARFVEASKDDIPVRGFVITDEGLLGELYPMIQGDAPAEVFDAIKAMRELSITQTLLGEDQVRFRVEAKFSKNGAAESLAAVIRQGVDQGIQELEGVVQQFPAAQTILDVLKAITVTGQDKSGVFRFTSKRFGFKDFMLPFIGTVRSTQF